MFTLIGVLSEMDFNIDFKYPRRNCFCTDLEIFLSVVVDRSWFDLSVLNVYLVATEHNGDVVTHPGQVTVPIRHILIGDFGCHIKHQDCTLA